MTEEDKKKNVNEKLKKVFQLPDTFVAEFTSDLLKNPVEIFMNEYLGSVAKLAEWTFIYLLGYIGFSYAWIISGFLLYTSRSHLKQLLITDDDVLVTDRRESVVSWDKTGMSWGKTGVDILPSWVIHPDVDRAHWVNMIIRKLWPHCDVLSEKVAKLWAEPKIKQILDRLGLKDLSNFKLTRFTLGGQPASVGGIKVYDQKNTDQDEIIIDIQIIYQGDASVSFTVQNLGCEITDVTFRGTVRMVIKPLLDTFPLIGGFQIYFLEMPVYSYSLGKMANFAEIPGISNMIKSVLDTIIKRILVWPHRFSFLFPLESVKRLQDISIMMPVPEGVLRIRIPRARNLIAKDKYVLGSGKSDPYVNLSVGQKVVSFKHRYAEETLDPEWNYVSEFLLEDAAGLSLNIEVFDFDQGREDDFLGQTTVPVQSVIDGSFSQGEEWMKLDGVKHGEIAVILSWCPVYTLDKGMKDTTDMYIVCVYIESCRNLPFDKTNAPHSRCIISLRSSGSADTDSPLKRKSSRKWSLSSSVKSTDGDSYSTKAKGPSSNPRFSDGHYFSTRKPYIDNIVVQVIDAKNGSNYGEAVLPVSYLFNQQDNQFFNMECDLYGQEETVTQAKVILSCKLLCCDLSQV